MVKKKLRKTKDIILGSSFALQGTQLITKPRTVHNLTNTAEGFIGLGIAGTAANVAFDMASYTQPRKRRRR